MRYQMIFFAFFVFAHCHSHPTESCDLAQSEPIMPTQFSLMDISTDGSKVAIRDGGNGIWVYSFETGNPLQVVRGHVGQVQMATFIENDTKLLTASDDQTARIWDLQSCSSPAPQIFYAKGPVSQAVLSQDGSKIMLLSNPMQENGIKNLQVDIWSMEEKPQLQASTSFACGMICPWNRVQFVQNHPVVMIGEGSSIDSVIQSLQGDFSVLTGFSITHITQMDLSSDGQELLVQASSNTHGLDVQLWKKDHQDQWSKSLNPSMPSGIGSSYWVFSSTGLSQDENKIMVFGMDRNTPHISEISLWQRKSLGSWEQSLTLYQSSSDTELSQMSEGVKLFVPGQNWLLSESKGHQIALWDLNQKQKELPLFHLPKVISSIDSTTN